MDPTKYNSLHSDTNSTLPGPCDLSKWVDALSRPFFRNQMMSEINIDLFTMNKIFI